MLKPNDYVVCVEDTGRIIGPGQGFLEKGIVYQILQTKTFFSSSGIKVQLKGNPGWFRAERFKLLEPELAKVLYGQTNKI